MATLNRSPAEPAGPPGRAGPAEAPPDDGRGQILLIAAFALAVIFVALALVLNSAIFTENLASRGEVTGSSEGLHYLHQVNESVADAMERANTESPGSAEDSLRASVSAIGRQGGTQQITGGQLVNVSVNSIDTDGVRIADEAPSGSAFNNESAPPAASAWRLASDVEAVRNVQVTVDERSSLADPAVDPLTFRINETGDPTDAWELQLWRDGTDVVVGVETASGRSGECRTGTATDVEIDVTGGVVDGQRCHALTRTGPDGDPMFLGTDLTGDYQIWIENGAEVEGNYSMIVDGTEDDSNLASPAAGDDPYYTDAIYSARIDYVFRTPDVAYEATARVARGEVPS